MFAHEISLHGATRSSAGPRFISVFNMAYRNGRSQYNPIGPIADRIQSTIGNNPVACEGCVALFRGGSALNCETYIPFSSHSRYSSGVDAKNIFFLLLRTTDKQTKAIFRSKKHGGSSFTAEGQSFVRRIN